MAEEIAPLSKRCTHEVGDRLMRIDTDSATTALVCQKCDTELAELDFVIYEPPEDWLLEPWSPW